ncbi:hypothetical protein OUZ56_032495 [Daphnia magna]|uniref:Uncharacterized protein n=1 Tax=Daphnia magna TaxID=35525 RepID=A0ABR0B926_9CRUS|nr:hypothetical protein OUZ56_032495 [Daphnia magna]
MPSQLPQYGSAASTFQRAEATSAPSSSIVGMRTHAPAPAVRPTRAGWRPSSRKSLAAPWKRGRHDSPGHGDDARLRRHRCAVVARRACVARPRRREEELQRGPRRLPPEHQRLVFPLFCRRPRPDRQHCRRATGLVAVSNRLAWLIARDGEGATKVTTVTVRGAASDDAARAIADRVAASGLVRTALFGNDPNWGRFVSQVGNAREVVDAQALVCTLQGVEVFRSGEPRPFDAGSLSKAMAVEDVALDLSLRDGDGEAMLMTSDLSYRYVEVNAEYTT